MKKESGFPITKPRDRIVNQRTWRTIGMVSLGVCCVLAWYGVKPAVTGLGLPMLGVYWGCFLLALLVTLYMVLLDFRYIRLMYLQGERQLFEETLGSEDFRRALLKREQALPPDSKTPGES